MQELLALLPDWLGVYLLVINAAAFAVYGADKRRAKQGRWRVPEKTLFLLAIVGGSKDHGRRNQIEGKLTPGERVVVIEDLISTGGSVLDTVAALRAAGAEVLGVISIFTYGMAKGRQRLAEAGVKCVSLTDLDTIAQVGVQQGYITQGDVARLLAFRDDPSDENSIRKGE